MPEKLRKRASAIVNRAVREGLCLVTAESCTAGALATLLADAPGAGDCLCGGLVTYTKSCKSALLGIPPAVIRHHTAVSREVAERMARGARAASGADIAVAITGVLGPAPDNDGNPVGLMHIAVAARGSPMHHVEIRSGMATRAANRRRALSEALTLLAKALADVSEPADSQKKSGPRPSSLSRKAERL